MDLMTVIKERKSVRAFSKEPVPDTLILEVLEAARLAPSWTNTQTWRFIVVKDADTRQKLSETLGASNPCRQAIADAPVVLGLASSSRVGRHVQRHACHRQGRLVHVRRGRSYGARGPCSLEPGTRHVPRRGLRRAQSGRDFGCPFRIFHRRSHPSWLFLANPSTAHHASP